MIKKRLLYLSIILLLVAPALIILLGYFYLGYHGPRDFVSRTQQADIKAVVNNARQLKGVPYDPFMGGYGNVGAKWGAIVCSDVINIAYGLAGFSWRQALAQDLRQHPSFYDTRQGNTPANPYFHRRARNLYAYFVANRRLQGKTYAPKPGDLVFYRKSPNGAIAHVSLVTEAGATQASVQEIRLMESAPRTVLAQEVSFESPLRRGWIFAGYGSMH